MTQANKGTAGASQGLHSAPSQWWISAWSIVPPTIQMSSDPEPHTPESAPPEDASHASSQTTVGWQAARERATIRAGACSKVPR